MTSKFVYTKRLYRILIRGRRQNCDAFAFGDICPNCICCLKYHSTSLCVCDVIYSSFSGPQPSAKYTTYRSLSQSFLLLWVYSYAVADWMNTRLNMMLPLHIVITVDPLGNLCAEIGHGELALEWILMADVLYLVSTSRDDQSPFCFWWR